VTNVSSIFYFWNKLHLQLVCVTESCFNSRFSFSRNLMLLLGM
jgi:hypothetical protein